MEGSSSTLETQSANEKTLTLEEFQVNRQKIICRVKEKCDKSIQSKRAPRRRRAQKNTENIQNSTTLKNSTTVVPVQWKEFTNIFGEKLNPFVAGEIQKIAAIFDLSVLNSAQIDLLDRVISWNEDCQLDLNYDEIIAEVQCQSSLPLVVPRITPSHPVSQRNESSKKSSQVPIRRRKENSKTAASSSANNPGPSGSCAVSVVPQNVNKILAPVSNETDEIREKCSENSKSILSSRVTSTNRNSKGSALSNSGDSVCSSVNSRLKRLKIQNSSLKTISKTSKSSQNKGQGSFQARLKPHYAEWIKKILKKLQHPHRTRPSQLKNYFDPVSSPPTTPSEKHVPSVIDAPPSVLLPKTIPKNISKVVQKSKAISAINDLDSTPSSSTNRSPSPSQISHKNLPPATTSRIDTPPPVLLPSTVPKKSVTPSGASNEQSQNNFSPIITPQAESLETNQESMLNYDCTPITSPDHSPEDLVPIITLDDDDESQNEIISIFPIQKVFRANFKDYFDAIHRLERKEWEYESIMRNLETQNGVKIIKTVCQMDHSCILEIHGNTIEAIEKVEGELKNYFRSMTFVILYDNSVPDEYGSVFELEPRNPESDPEQDEAIAKRGAWEKRIVIDQKIWNSLSSQNGNQDNILLKLMESIKHKGVKLINRGLTPKGNFDLVIMGFSKENVDKSINVLCNFSPLLKNRIWRGNFKYLEDYDEILLPLILTDCEIPQKSSHGANSQNSEQTSSQIAQGPSKPKEMSSDGGAWVRPLIIKPRDWTTLTHGFEDEQELVRRLTQLVEKERVTLTKRDTAYENIGLVLVGSSEENVTRASHRVLNFFGQLGDDVRCGQVKFSPDFNLPPLIPTNPRKFTQQFQLGVRKWARLCNKCGNKGVLMSQLEDLLDKYSVTVTRLKGSTNGSLSFNLKGGSQKNVMNAFKLMKEFCRI